MEDVIKINGMRLEKKHRSDDVKCYHGDHAFGGLVSFYTYPSTDKNNKSTEKWVWSYNGADSCGHDTLSDAVSHWKDTCS